MTESPLFWIAATLLCIVCESFFTCTDMACVSLNRIRLQFLVSKGHRRARMIDGLLSNPSRLFGTTLLGLNAAMQIGSECSRRVYSLYDLSPDLAPLTQIILVVVLAELAPMFAARRYPQHISMAGAPILFAASKLFTPFIWFFSLLSDAVHYLFGQSQDETSFYLSREELKTVLAHEDEGSAKSGGDDFNMVVHNIFALKEKTASQIMQPLSAVTMIPSTYTVGKVRQQLRSVPSTSFLPIYNESKSQVVGIILPRDLIRIPDKENIASHGRPPWFVPRTTRIFRVLRQFRQNNQSVAFVLSEKGDTIGLLTLDDVLGEIFNKGALQATEGGSQARHRRLVEKAFPGEMPVSEFNALFEGNLPVTDAQSLYDLMTAELGHDPAEGESARIGDYELTVLQSTLLGAKTVEVRTIAG